MENKSKRIALRVTPSIYKFMKDNKISGKTIRQYIEDLKKRKVKFSW